jgi:hypothetical protein
MPTLPPAFVAQVSELVSQYIAAQRDTYVSRAFHLSPQQRAATEPFVSHNLLDEVRVLVLTGERVANPDFYPMLQAAGFENLPDQSQMAAITFSDCVVAHVALPDGLLFHELVHVEQYRQLGIPQFADLYLKGFLSGGGYYQIPLEQNAYSVGERFEENTARYFSVAEEVAQWISEGRF